MTVIIDLSRPNYSTHKFELIETVSRRCKRYRVYKLNQFTLWHEYVGEFWSKYVRYSALVKEYETTPF